jgi:hypothetical protein
MITVLLVIYSTDVFLTVSRRSTCAMLTQRHRLNGRFEDNLYA